MKQGSNFRGEGGEEALENRIDPNALQLKDQVVSINRVTKVVKGGKNLSFSALVVVGDGAGIVGYGSGKAREVPMAIRKGIEAAKKALVKIHVTPTSIPHTVIGHYGAGKVLLKPAAAGTGVIAGGGARSSRGSRNSERIDKVAWDHQSLQRCEGDRGRSPPASQQGGSGGYAGQDRGRTLKGSSYSVR